MGSDSRFVGMAPDARLVSLKVADAAGNTDVTQVIAAIDWVVQHRNDNGLNVRVLLLAYGTDSSALWESDPLVHAAEVAWRNGIFVVVAAGNNGVGVEDAGTLGNPAFSPNLMTVGASDTNGTIDFKDDFIPGFSSFGSKDREVDMVAPGSHIISLKVPGSFAEQNFAATGAYGDRFFLGSGTSQAAAVVAGAAALVLQQRPELAPDQLKELLIDTSKGLKHAKSAAEGDGTLDLTKAFDKKSPKLKFDKDRKWSNGKGSLDASRGSKRLIRNGVELRGEVDIFGNPFDCVSMATVADTISAWSGGTWNGIQWAEGDWSASSWSASSWSSGDWSASSWSASSWSASSWGASSWSASSWSGSDWSASSWSASSWSASTWSSNVWASAGWY